MTIDHELYMHRCLQLAKAGEGYVAPNPMVGALLVHDERIIGEGYHQKYGEAHAEVNCINSVSDLDKHLIEKSTLYVSLEPCSHHGKTPPCSDLIIKYKIPKVTIGCQDSYKEVAGKGIEKLKAAGIEVINGILEKECLEINKRFFTFHEKQRPYIILKWAESMNGCIANGDRSRVYISNDYTNRLVHKWRGEEAAILIGKNTALFDNPALTTRHWEGNHPVRMVIDLDLQVPLSLKIFNKESKTVIFNRTMNEESGNIIYSRIDSNNALPEILNTCCTLGLQSLIVEGGRKLLQSFIDCNLWDEARVITNENLLIDNGIDAPILHSHHIAKSERYTSDVVTYYELSTKKAM
jgi:diaminohydroxyphosphoribosylaminopyrimidine deaminase / 5-amino-6-(5-phosphoribosylamino)uracil reductase